VLINFLLRTVFTVRMDKLLFYGVKSDIYKTMVISYTTELLYTKMFTSLQFWWRYIPSV